MTFNQSYIPKEVKIGYCLKRVKQHIPPPPRCFKCQKYGHHTEAYRRRLTCVKCSEKELHHAEEVCSNEMKCPNSRLDHPAYSRSCDIYKREEILEVKHKKSFSEAKKIHGTEHLRPRYTKGGPNQTEQSRQQIQSSSGETDSIGTNDWPKFQGQLENLHLAV